MIKNFFLLVLVFLLGLTSSYGQGSETFNNSNATASYNDSSFTGDNGVTWSYVESRDEDAYAITGNGLMLRRSSDNSKVTSSSVAGGIGDFTCKLKKAFTGIGNRQVALYVNGVLKGTSIAWDNTTVQTFSVTGINTTGNVVIEIRNITSKQVIIDDISWTAATTSDLTISGTPTDHGSSCLNAAAASVQYTITNNGTGALNGINVVSNNTQFVVSGLSSTTIAASGTATYNVTFTPTSAGNQTATIDVDNTTNSDTATSNLNGTGTSVPIIDTQPNSLAIPETNTATFTVAATNAISYQWQVSTGGVFTNVTTGTGGTTNNYTTEASTIAMDGNQYQCIITNLCGNVTSSAANLNVFSVANVVITELSYNSSGTDDEWIEICNISGSSQDLSGYVIDNGSPLFTFPLSTTIANGSCITVSLGSSGDGIYNNDCSFTPDFGISASTNNTNNLNNSSDTINLFASDGITISDSVFYDDSDGADNNGSTLHVIDATIDNSDTDTNWQEVLNGGSPGANTLTSPCSVPELQLVDASNTDQACGFSIDFNSQATGFNTDITFDIVNDGALDLDISSLILSGTNLTEFLIVSPTTPFTISSENTQTVTVRFSPSTIGSKNAILTINSNDADEGSCTVLLEGTGTSPEQEINVEGNIGFFPDISNGDVTPIALDNTLFAAQNIGNSQSKSFRIQNLGTANLIISGVTIGGANPGDFIISSAPAGIVTPMQDPPTTFEITFSPIASGTRTAIVNIASNDIDENPYTFMVQGDGNCNPGSITISPTTGPANTIVTVTGTNLSSASATYNGVPTIVTNISSTKLEVTVPVGESSGTIDIIDDLGCPASATFTVIKNFGSCGNPSDLMMTEVYDQVTGSRGYIEIYNATGSTIDLTDYQIDRYGTLVTGSISHSYTFPSSGVGSSIADGQTLVGRVNSGGTGVEDFDFGGSVSGFNEDDRLELFKISTATVVDDFHDAIDGATGYVYRRNTSVSNPNSNFDASEWTIATQDNTSDLGSYTILANTPIISAHPQPIDNCDSDIIFNVSATPGNSGSLTYLWKYNDGTSNSWVDVLSSSFSPGTVTGENTNTLSITGVDLENYQFYCEITEDGSCSTASYAARINISSSTWSAGSWDNGIPDINTKVIINDDYNTAAAFQNSGINACNLTVNSGATLTINEGFTVVVENDVINNGNILVETDGSFVQNNDAATFTNSVNDNSKVAKKTAVLNAWYEYTYWSSPVNGEQVDDVFVHTNANRRYTFNASNFRDSGYETNNNNILIVNASSAGVDEEDDNGNDWVIASALNTMQPGVGHAATLSIASYNAAPNSQFDHVFEGPFNNGIITVPVYRNDAELLDFNNNFIGNPYPSAISVDLFMAENTYSASNTSGTLDGAIYLWSHDAPLSSTANGNSGLNFGNSDYAIINETGEVAGGDNNNDGMITAADEPNRFIASGQGFFVMYDNSGAVNSTFNNPNENNDLISQGEITFRNSMRVVGNNNQFFKSGTMPAEDNKLWLLLTTDNGINSQILVGYKDGATNADDGGRFDARRNASNGMASFLYSTIETSQKKYAIQGKAKTSLNLDEVIPIGVYTTINVPTIYTIAISHYQGDFFNNNTIYLKDNLLSLTHNLSNSDYVFTSEIGDFSERFEIVFTSNTLNTNAFEAISNNLSIIALENNNVKFIYNGTETIKSVTIVDVLGRILYNFKGSKNIEVFNLSNLSSTTYIAQIELSNGKLISKKAIKK